MVDARSLTRLGIDSLSRTARLDWMGHVLIAESRERYLSSQTAQAHPWVAAASGILPSDALVREVSLPELWVCRVIDGV